MTDPTRLRILKAMSAALKTITPDNGYMHDLSDFDDDGVTKPRVVRGRNVFDQNDPVPLVSILEMPREPGATDTPRGSGALSGPWELMVQGWVDDDPLNPTDPAHPLMAEVKVALLRERAKLATTPGLRGTVGLFGERAVTDIQLAPGVVRPPDETSAKAFFWLVVTLQVTEDASNPFA